MSKPILTLPRFVRAHTAVNDTLLRYKSTKRGKKLSQEAFESLFDRASTSLKATNAKARIVVAATADWQLKELFSKPGDPVKLFWVTITPAATAISLNVAREFLPERMRANIARLFEGIDYFGMIDVAFYPRSPPLRKRKTKPVQFIGPIVAYHVHLLAWGCDESAIIRIRDVLTAACVPLVPNTAVFYFRIVSRKTALRKNIYQLKAPVKSYAAWTDMEEVADPLTGEIRWCSVGDWQRKKRDIRPGEAARIHNVMCGFNIPELMLGGGEGLGLKRRVISIATNRLRFSVAGARLIARYKLA